MKIRSWLTCLIIGSKKRSERHPSHDATRSLSDPSHAPTTGCSRSQAVKANMDSQPGEALQMRSREAWTGFLPSRSQAWIIRRFTVGHARKAGDLKTTQFGVNLARDSSRFNLPAPVSTCVAEVRMVNGASFPAPIALTDCPAVCSAESHLQGCRDWASCDACPVRASSGRTLRGELEERCRCGEQA